MMMTAVVLVLLSELLVATVSSLPISVRYVRIQAPKCMFLNLREVEAFDSVNSNVALGKPARLVSQYVEDGYGPYTPDKCVDGDITVEYKRRMCIANWGGFWEVDLLTEFSLAKIVVYNRPDDHDGFDSHLRLDGATLSLFDERRQAVETHRLGSAQVQTISLGVSVLQLTNASSLVSYVRVHPRPCEFLNLREVEVYSGGMNVALGKPARLLSEYKELNHGPYYASLCVDGDTTVEYKRFMCIANVGGWWEVDLKGAFSVDRIVIYNRQDEMESARRLNGGKLELFSTSHTLIRSVSLRGAFVQEIQISKASTNQDIVVEVDFETNNEEDSRTTIIVIVVFASLLALFVLVTVFAVMGYMLGRRSAQAAQGGGSVILEPSQQSVPAVQVVGVVVEEEIQPVEDNICERNRLGYSVANGGGKS